MTFKRIARRLVKVNFDLQFIAPTAMILQQKQCSKLFFAQIDFFYLTTVISIKDKKRILDFVTSKVNV